ncbi:lysylphosphatidylglycerol synthase transmembrane domain-containing protein [Chryseobacterium oryctis]|uniref:Flippase-like domain-containing protein n=1 Tax=Chryseobacterium oryctis TaxID=2952618 RepID=A0ABT3HJJ8_9FLAO|nr:lysylphosphatidylglycerol synthase transmembrane domain-containing protein [Chryseobacterium oryctis]MCW3159944.1 flippase-like domain-containing protein [Chryseobacterium oryctis]
MEKTKLKKLLINTAKILVSIVLLYFVFKKIPFKDVAQLWSTVNVFYIILAAFFFLASQVLSTKRLEFYLDSNNFNLNFKSNLELYFLGMFYNFFIPGGIGGDAYKVYILNKKFGWSAKKITSALFNDRLSGLLAICVLILCFSAFLFEVQWVLLIIGLIILGIGFTYFLTKKIFSTYTEIFFKTFAISIIIQLLQVICFFLIMKSLGVHDNFTIYTVTFLGSSILSLISFAGIGVREMLFLQASKYFEFNASISVSASLLFTVITAFFSLFGIIFQLRKLNLNLREK